MKLLELFLWLSATDVDIYKSLTKREKGERIAYSSFVLVVGIFAFITSSYFTSTLFTSYDEFSQTAVVSRTGRYVSIFIGLLWSFTVMLIDRMIISSMSKKSALFRIPLAIAIGLVVAIPLETRLFDGRIKKRIELNQRTENNAFKSELTGKVEQINRELNQVRSNMAEAIKSMTHYKNEAYFQDGGKNGYPAGKGSGYDEAISNFELHKKLADELKSRERELLDQRLTAEKKVELKYEAGKIDQSLDFPSRYEVLHEIKEESPPLKRLGWAITALFVLIELIPALLKLVKEESTYDVAIAAKNNIRQQAIIIVQNQALTDMQAAGGNSLVNNPDLHPRTIVNSMMSTL